MRNKLKRGFYLGLGLGTEAVARGARDCCLRARMLEPAQHKQQSREQGRQSANGQ